MLKHLTLQPQLVVALPLVTTPLDASLSAFLLAQEAARHTPRTLEHYRYTVGSVVTWLHGQGVNDVTAITSHDIHAYIVSPQKRGVKDTTQHAHARGIRAWCNWLVAEDDLSASPMRRVQMPTLEARMPPPFAPDEAQKLLAACDRHTPIGSRNYAILMTLLDTGLRASELVSLRLGDIDSRSGLVTVFGKGQKQRQVLVGAKARATIIKMIGYRPGAKPRDPLWLAYDGLTQEPAGEQGRSLTMHGLQMALRRLGERAGVTPCGPHRFRRTFALWCLRDGMDLHSLRVLMGHSTLAILQRYLALAGEDIERAHAAHSPVDKLLR